MNAIVQRKAALAASLAAASIVVSSHMGTTAARSRTAKTAEPRSWNEKSAAVYLDRRQDWWMEWQRAKRDHETFCISCHTSVPYALSRPALRKALAEQDATAEERRLLENVRRRVRLWNEVAPFYSDADRGVYKTAESRGTESVLNALILASQDAQNGQLSTDTRTSFDNMWGEQQTSGNKKGAWQWLRFGNEPWEADDSDYYGATLAAVALGTAPGNYRATSEIQSRLEMLREYLNREYTAQTAINRASLLWAAEKVPGLIRREQRDAIIAELLGKQEADGGWSLSSLVGKWKRADGTPQETNSDGYATGLIVFTLEEVGITPENARLKRGLAWLTRNQDRTEGSWVAYSLNKNKEHHISPETALFMKDAATAYAVLALTEANRNWQWASE
jgi:squalene-hopene/tetraprenyl-beta-curcumene cyclase